MNIKVNTNGGGPFSKFMVAIQSLSSIVENVDSINDIYITFGHVNPFNHVLEQKKDLNFDLVIDAMKNHQERYKKYGSQTYKDLNNSRDLLKLKKICSKLKIKNNILEKINKNIDSNTLGVHVRLTDMNGSHPEYGVYTINDYISKIKEILSEKKEIKKIFISSDNDISLNKLKPMLLNMGLEVYYNEVSNRSKKEDDKNYTRYLRTNENSEKLWVDSFLDMLSLSKCGDIICRVSNLNNASISFNGDKNVHKL